MAKQPNFDNWSLFTRIMNLPTSSIDDFEISGYFRPQDVYLIKYMKNTGSSWNNALKSWNSKCWDLLNKIKDSYGEHKPIPGYDSNYSLNPKPDPEKERMFKRLVDVSKYDFSDSEVVYPCPNCGSLLYVNPDVSGICPVCRENIN